ncbi:hypothetical protein TELCIR_03031 [Teladorsagia circumcincta]|uniref:Uncharacterized protein n=1 Tax=Teladorsagia circumcincta TaxID=45464 RepID=A0A2G9UYZ4_TELCI|nr:hypothetical protein TELCIR_03031 [Teladorsagia circumcincta]
MVKSLSYRCHSAGKNPRVVLALLYLPPSVSTRFLSLYSVYPISRCTYYGVDSGTLGLKLSLFFDMIMATCLPEAEFVSSHLETNKSDRNFNLLEQARREIWKRFHLCKSRALCSQSAPHCARALMLTAEYLVIRARGRGGLRSGPAANPVFTRIFDSIRKSSEGNHHVRELFHVVKEDWLRSETKMIRADLATPIICTLLARHFEAAAQIFTQREVERICQKHFIVIPSEGRYAIPESVTVEAAARIDLFGGWLDTPPITLHAQPSAVINMAKPIACRIRHGLGVGITVRCGETQIVLSCARDIYESHNKPANPGKCSSHD